MSGTAASSQRYLAPNAEATGELREKGSRFLAVLVPASDERSALESLKGLRDRFPDATHHCWAFRVGWPARERSSDAGEPAGTAGMPILAVLSGRGVLDALLVVVRWYGGTKLGKGGLARAYSGAAREALEVGTLVDRFPTVCVSLELPYERLGAVKRLIRPPEIELEAEAYADSVRLELRVAAGLEEVFLADLADLGIVAKAH